jgi:hypothetical protein
MQFGASGQDDIKLPISTVAKNLEQKLTSEEDDQNKKDSVASPGFN